MTDIDDIRRSPARWPEPEMTEPDDDTIALWICDGVVEATDGCMVEPDGICPHGHPSWLPRMGFI